MIDGNYHFQNILHSFLIFHLLNLRVMLHLHFPLPLLLQGILPLLWFHWLLLAVLEATSMATTRFCPRFYDLAYIALLLVSEEKMQNMEAEVKYHLIAPLSHRFLMQKHLIDCTTFVSFVQHGPTGMQFRNDVDIRDDLEFIYFPLIISEFVRDNPYWILGIGLELIERSRWFSHLFQRELFVYLRFNFSFFGKFNDSFQS